MSGWPHRINLLRPKAKISSTFPSQNNLTSIVLLQDKSQIDRSKSRDLSDFRVTYASSPTNASRCRLLGFRNRRSLLVTHITSSTSSQNSQTTQNHHINSHLCNRSGRQPLPLDHRWKPRFRHLLLNPPPQQPQFLFCPFTSPPFRIPNQLKQTKCPAFLRETWQTRRLPLRTKKSSWHASHLLSSLLTGGICSRQS